MDPSELRACGDAKRHRVTGWIADKLQTDVWLDGERKRPSEVSAHDVGVAAWSHRRALRVDGEVEVSVVRERRSRQ